MPRPPKASRGLFQRGAWWWIRYADAAGHYHREPARTTEKTQAAAFLARRRAEVAASRPGAPLASARVLPTLAELAKDYGKSCEAQRSWRTKRTMLDRMVSRLGPGLRLHELTPRLLEQYQAKRQAEKAKPATINRELATVRHMITKAVDWDIAPPELLARVRRVRLLPERNARLRFLSLPEIGRLLDACKTSGDPLLHPAAVLALYTGMRKGEILGLRWADVDLVHGYVFLPETKNDARREVPLRPEAVDALRAIPHRLRCPWVFAHKDGTRLREVKRAWAGAVKRAKIKDFRFHDCRHTFASHLVMSGVDLFTVGQLLGHKSPTMTARYAHLAPEAKAAALRSLYSGTNSTNAAQSAGDTGKAGS